MEELEGYVAACATQEQEQERLSRQIQVGGRWCTLTSNFDTVQARLAGAKTNAAGCGMV